MTTPSYALPLTKDEDALLSEIELDAGNLPHENAAHDGELVLRLIQALTSRDAIPRHRWGWFDDPEQNFNGRG